MVRLDVSAIGAPALLVGLYVAGLAACMACPVVSLVAGGWALSGAAVLAMGVQS